MNDLLEHAGPIVTIAVIVVNFVWSSLNLRLMRSMEKKFVTRETFQAEQRVQHIRHNELARRIGRMEGA